MQIEETREKNTTEVDEDTVDKKTIVGSQSCNETPTVDNGDEVCAVPEAGVKVCEDVRYEKYFKMKQFGVPPEAVKLKMSAEGLDSSLLE